MRRSPANRSCWRSVSAHTRATIAPTVRQAIRINSHTALFEHRTANQATVSSNARVCPSTPAQTAHGSVRRAKNVHRMVHRALRDAVAWDYMISNPAEHASLPRQRRGERNRAQPWTVEELVAWLRLALDDRFAAMWL